MKNRKKKIAAVVIAVCVIAGLAIAIHKPKVVEEIAQPTETTAVEITVAPIKIMPKKAVATANSAEENPSEPLDELTAETKPTDVEQGEEIVQNFTEPPEIPSEQATNPAAPPTYTPEQTVREVTTTAPKIKTPQEDATKGGKTYIPGLGWIPENKGTVVQKPADDMRENGNKIGTFG
jgi:hypothetical protein